MKAVIIGGSGHIGTYLTPMLIRAGYDVTVVTRGEAKPYEEDPAWRYAHMLRMDRKAEPRFAEKIAEMAFDIVVDLINFDVKDTRAMVESLSGTRCAQYLYCSSCWAHGRAKTLPLDPNDLRKQPLDPYGKDKFASEAYLKEQYRLNGFPATVILPGQISGPGWTIINPWGNTSMRVFQDIADGKQIYLPNFGMETLHHVHGYDVAQVFYQAITHRNQALGESFDAEAESQITLYGYAEYLYWFFGREAKIGFLPWKEWCEYEGDPQECEHTYYHIARSGVFGIEKEKRLLDYKPKFTNLDAIDLAVKSYIARGLIKV